jgi:RNA polymerase sigma-70 factor (ECF subfamily)
MATLDLQAPLVLGLDSAAFGRVREGGPEEHLTVAADDPALMERVAVGDASAYRILVDRHLRGLHAFVYRMLGNRAEAEEVCQESFLRLWTEASRYVPRAKLTTWLYRIGHNLAVDRLRRRREGGKGPDPDELPDSRRPSSILQDKELSQAVQVALDALPERQRAALVLVHYQGMSNAEAAEVLAVNVRALESLLARGRRELRESLAQFQEGRQS